MRRRIAGPGRAEAAHHARATVARRVQVAGGTGVLGQGWGESFGGLGGCGPGDDHTDVFDVEDGEQVQQPPPRGRLPVVVAVRRHAPCPRAAPLSGTTPRSCAAPRRRTARAAPTDASELVRDMRARFAFGGGQADLDCGRCGRP